MRYGHLGFGFGFPLFGFWFRDARHFPRRIHPHAWKYRKELEEELKDVEREIKELNGES